MRTAFVAAVLALVASVAGILTMITPSTEAVRVRNSLLFEAVDERELMWKPSNVPADFKQESGEAPPRLREFLADIDRSGKGLSFGVQVGRKLIENRKRGGAIQSDTLNTLDTILSEGIGYCADYTQVVNGLAYTAGVPVREWGMSFEGFGGDGHAFNELYDESFGKWVFIDTFYSFYAVDQASGTPLSALEFRDRLRREDAADSVELIPIRDRGYRFDSEAKAIEYYRRGVEQFYLTYGNNVLEYDRASLVSLGAAVSRAAEQALGILSGVHPGIRIARTAENAGMIERLERTRKVFLALLGLGIVSGLVATITAIALLRRRRSTAR